MRQIEFAMAYRHLVGMYEDGSYKAMAQVMQYRVSIDKATGEQISTLVDKIIEPNVKVHMSIDGSAAISVNFKDPRNYEKCAELIESANGQRENSYDIILVKIRDMKTQQICVEMQLNNCMMIDASQTAVFVADEEDFVAYVEDDNRSDNTMQETGTHATVKELFSQFSNGEEAVVTLQHHRADNGRAVNEARIATQQIGLKYHNGVFELTIDFDSFEDEGYQRFVNLIATFQAAISRDGYQSYGVRLFVTNKEQKRVVMFQVGHMKFDEETPTILMISPCESTMAFNTNK